MEEAPGAYGVCEIADEKKERILIAHGILAEELARIVRDPFLRRAGASYFRFQVTMTSADAERLASELRRAYVPGGLHRLSVRDPSR